MANRLVKLADTEYTPAVLEVIARPAYCTTVSRVRAVTSYVYTNRTGVVGYTHTTSPDPTNPSSNLGYNSPVTTPVYRTTRVRTPVTRYITVYEDMCFPAVPGVEGRDARLLDIAVEGWDAAARSLLLYTDDITLAFEFNPGGAGMLCGLTPAGRWGGRYTDIRHGLRLDSGRIYVTEYGVDKASISYTPGDRPSIRRVGSRVSYHLGDWGYESLIPGPGTLVVGACLYLSGDFIDSPVVSRLIHIAVTSEWGWRDLNMPIHRLSVRAPWGWGARVTMGEGFVSVDFPVGMAASQDSYGGVAVDIGGVAVQSNDTPLVLGSRVFPSFPYNVAAQGSKVSIGGVDGAAGSFEVAASDYVYGEAVFDVFDVGVAALSYDEPKGTGSASELFLVRDAYTSDPVIYASILERLGVGSTIDVLLAIDAGIVDYLVPGDTADAAMVFGAVLSSTLHVSDNQGVVRNAVLQYATNLITGAVGRYEGFDFRGFVKSGMQTFGWKPDGLYRMGYAEDTGEEIQALIDFAAEDFDTTNRKSIRALFFGVDTDGVLYARLVDDNDCDATYRVIPHGDTQRANPAQRPTSRFWRLRLEIADATFADLDNVEWKAATTGRRTRS